MGSLISGIPRSQVEEFRILARELGLRHPHVYGAFLIGRNRPVPGVAAPSPYGVTLQHQAARCPVPPTLAIQSHSPSATFECGVFGGESVVAAFYGDQPGLYAYLDLAQDITGIGVEYSKAGRLPSYPGCPGWFAGVALLVYMMETADRHGDGMRLRTEEGTILHPDWVGPCKSHTLRPGAFQSAAYMLAAALSREAEPDPAGAGGVVGNLRPADPPKAASRRRGDLAIEIEGRFLALARRFNSGQSKSMPTQADLARHFGCDEGVVSRVIKPLRPIIDKSQARDRRRPNRADDD
jgi:hypothetical protein